jgi:hypothetical protein
MNAKHCTVCQTEKPIEEFYRDKNRKGGREYRCKSCHADRDRLVDKETYEAMLLLSGGTCYICGGVNQSGRFLAVDHDHETGEVRGLLCDGCNRGIGFLGDDPERLRRAAAYLSVKKNESGRALLPSPMEEESLPSSN